jgi:ABC-type glycerol-3-phosphate transport system permease component
MRAALCLGSAARATILMFEFRLVVFVLLQRHYVRGVSEGAFAGF